MTRATKIIIYSTLVILILVIVAIALLSHVCDAMNRQTLIIQNPAGLGQVRFTKLGSGIDGPLELTVEAKRSGDRFWTSIGSFGLHHGDSAEFQKARWACNGTVLVIHTRYAQGASGIGYWADDGKTYIRKKKTGMGASYDHTRLWFSHGAAYNATKQQCGGH